MVMLVAEPNVVDAALTSLAYETVATLRSRLEDAPAITVGLERAADGLAFYLVSFIGFVGEPIRATMKYHVMITGPERVRAAEALHAFVTLLL
jgi:hypothetical protein